MIRIAVLLALVLARMAAAAPDYGLLENRTDLPLVFPLQVRSDPGEDRLVTLRDAQTGKVALTARLEGGAFFRVLVPLGTYLVEFASGVTWQGDRPVEGPTARRVTIRPALTFEVTGPARKAGHLVDLRGEGPPETRPIALCQSFGYDVHALTELRDYYDAPLDLAEGPRRPPSRELTERLCD